MYAHVLKDSKQSMYARLMACSRGKDNDEVLACMLSSWQAGEGALPENIGLRDDEYQRMLGFHFPGLDDICLMQPQKMLDPVRTDELEEVIKLLLTHRAGKTDSELWIADIVAVACQGQDHLWQDLGLWSRKDLSELLWRNFPELARKNDKDMKWKKFIYKQLCITEGIYTCRAPSCEVCADYEKCFGPED